MRLKRNPKWRLMGSTSCRLCFSPAPPGVTTATISQKSAIPQKTASRRHSLFKDGDPDKKKFKFCHEIAAPLVARSMGYSIRCHESNVTTSFDVTTKIFLSVCKICHTQHCIKLTHFEMPAKPVLTSGRAE